MQLIPRYLVKNKINIISDDVGLMVEYRPVYQRTIRISRGIDNVIQFKILNADQKPVIITKTPVFVAFDENQQQILEIQGTVLDDGSTRNTLGVFTVTITDTDLLNIPQQYLKYNVYLKDDYGNKSMTYANTDFTSAGTMYVDGASFPAPKPNTVINQFYNVDTYWCSVGDRINPESNGSVYTTVIYPNGYEGDVTIQATLDQSIGLNWFDINTITITGLETEPVCLNFSGMFTFIRVKLDTNPATNTPRILLRN